MLYTVTSSYSFSLTFSFQIDFSIPLVPPKSQNLLKEIENLKKQQKDILCRVLNHGLLGGSQVCKM